ncbi:MAG TPA: transglycosylase family protein [Candidatus Saccharimonadales bacterium]|nr:transglycosylase family protein [Candidatus Saccharimonadales bacterium]
MRLFAIAVMLFVGTLFFSAGNAAVHAQTTKKQKHGTKKIVVRRGDTLTKIAKRHKTTFPRIFYANTKIKNPDVIYTGEKLRIPSKDEKLKPRPFHEVAQVVTTRKAQTYAPKSNNAYSVHRSSAPKPTPVYTSYSGGVWDRLAQCESGGNWSINTGNGYYGGLQFTISSWRAVGGSGLPSQASKSEQIYRAKILQSRQGWGAWPACTSKLGIR